MSPAAATTGSAAWDAAWARASPRAAQRAMRSFTGGDCNRCTMAPAMAAKKNDLDDELARLYRGPLEGFTAARNDFAKQLRKLGKDADADRVKSLAKPTPSAWAVNVLFDRDREKMDALLVAGMGAGTAEQQVVS